MYLSCLLIDVGDNPDRPRPGRLWLRNLYHVHQRLCMAFPSAVRVAEDREFLKPFSPGDFGVNQVHVARKEDTGFLFRIDPRPPGRVVILVQSAIRPDWDYAFHNAGYLLACTPDVRQFNPNFQAGQSLRFRLVANPTKRFSKHSVERDGKPVAEKWVGKRVPVPSDKLLEWLLEWRLKGDPSAGFSLDKESTTFQPGYVYFRKPEKHPEDKPENKPGNEGKRLFSVRYEGTLQVTEAELFQQTLSHGIGPGKAFGFGLLSVAPLRGELRPERWEAGGET